MKYLFEIKFDFVSIHIFLLIAPGAPSAGGIAVGSRVTLIDAAGRQQGTWTVTGEQMTLDVSRLASGQYFLRISGAGVNTVKKLIVE